MWEAAAITGRRRQVLRTASTAVIAVALLVPAIGRSDVDQKPPTPPVAVAIAGTSSTTITMTWEAGQGRPAHEFALFRDGQGMASTAETSYTFTGLDCGNAYTLGMEALDSAGNRSNQVSVIAASEACPTPAPTPPTSPPLAPPAVVPPEPSSKELPSAPDIPASPTAPHPSDISPATGGSSAGVSWAGAGAFVWHETDIAPETLGLQLRANGFSWVALRMHDGLAVDPIEGDWIRRFRAASGLSVGGWGVLRTEPEREADLAHRLLDQYALDFYIANPEAEYKFSNGDGQSAERYGRSQQFVDRFRALDPEMPAGLSSYCRADTQDIDWGAWSGSGFVFLPQAYVNDLGTAASPSACARGAAGFFTTDAVHPTVGMYISQAEAPSPEHYVALLRQAGTIGFSVYLAETEMDAGDWSTFGKAIAELKITSVTSDEQVDDANHRGARSHALIEQS